MRGCMKIDDRFTLLYNVFKGLHDKLTIVYQKTKSDV